MYLSREEFSIFFPSSTRVELCAYMHTLQVGVFCSQFLLERESPSRGLELLAKSTFLLAVDRCRIRIYQVANMGRRTEGICRASVEGSLSWKRRVTSIIITKWESHRQRAFCKTLLVHVETNPFFIVQWGALYSAGMCRTIEPAL